MRTDIKVGQLLYRKTRGFTYDKNYNRVDFEPGFYLILKLEEESGIIMLNQDGKFLYASHYGPELIVAWWDKIT